VKNERKEATRNKMRFNIYKLTKQTENNNKTPKCQILMKLAK